MIPIFIPRTKVNFPKQKAGFHKGNLLFTLRVTGLEPAHLSAQEPKSCASANSATPAQHKYKIKHKQMKQLTIEFIILKLIKKINRF